MTLYHRCRNRGALGVCAPPPSFHKLLYKLLTSRCEVLNCAPPPPPQSKSLSHATVYNYRRRQATIKVYVFLTNVPPKVHPMKEIACSDAVHVTCANKVRNGPAKHGCSMYSQTRQLPCPWHVLNISLFFCRCLFVEEIVCCVFTVECQECN